MLDFRLGCSCFAGEEDHDGEAVRLLRILSSWPKRCGDQPAFGLQTTNVVLRGRLAAIF